MGGTAPISLEYTTILQTIDFYKELKEKILTSTHYQLALGNTVYVGCFTQHVFDANNGMPIPLNEDELNLIMNPLTSFLFPICNSTQSDTSICFTIAVILNQLIEGRHFITE